MYECPTEVIDEIEACATATVMQIPLDATFQLDGFQPAAVEQKLLAVAPRNRDLARFIANPRACPSRDGLLALISQFDNYSTGRYIILTRCLPGIPAFFKSKSTDSPRARVKKRKHTN